MDENHTRLLFSDDFDWVLLHQHGSFMESNYTRCVISKITDHENQTLRVYHPNVQSGSTKVSSKWVKNIKRPELNHLKFLMIILLCHIILAHNAVCKIYFPETTLYVGLFLIPFFFFRISFIFKSVIPKIWFPIVLVSVPGTVLLAGLAQYRRREENKRIQEDPECTREFVRTESVVGQGDMCYLQEKNSKTKADSMAFRLILSEIYLFQGAFLSTFSIAFKMHMYDEGAHSNETINNGVINTSAVNLAVLTMSSVVNIIQIWHAWYVYYSRFRNTSLIICFRL